MIFKRKLWRVSQSEEKETCLRPLNIINIYKSQLLLDLVFNLLSLIKGYIFKAVHWPLMRKFF